MIYRLNLVCCYRQIYYQWQYLSYSEVFAEVNILNIVKVQAPYCMVPGYQRSRKAYCFFSILHKVDVVLFFQHGANLPDYMFSYTILTLVLNVNHLTGLVDGYSLVRNSCRLLYRRWITGMVHGQWSK
jgi:hypothetical protein